MDVMPEVWRARQPARYPFVAFKFYVSPQRKPSGLP